MSSDGHCRHCEEDCQGGNPIPAWPQPEPHTDSDGSTWPTCPACAEAERIVQEILRHADHTAATSEDIDAGTAYRRCVAIANAYYLLPDGAYFI